MATLTNSNQMEAYRLSVIKTRLRFEAVGMKGRGGAMRPRMAAEFGLSPRDSFERFIAVAEERRVALVAEITRTSDELSEVARDLWAERRAEEQDYYDRANDHD
jgi:hypothetical protein